ncbi:MAG: aromatic amino acid transport family protein [Patescibacteria group bacterium]|jgi:amino acid permease
MKETGKNFWSAVGLMSGMILGSGLFALPFAMGVSGLRWSLLFSVVAFFAVISVQLAYGEVVVNTPGRHRLPGYVRHYLGSFAGRFESVNQILTLNGILVGYALLAGIFLSQLFGGSIALWTLVFFIVCGALLIGKATQIGEIDLILTIPLVGALLAIAIAAATRGSFVHLAITPTDPFFVFAVIVFSLTGYTIIPDVYQIFHGARKNRFHLREAIVVGSAIPFFVSIIFGIGVLMASGTSVSVDAISGLVPTLGVGVVQFGAAMGLLAVFTSYLAIGYDLKELYVFDVKMSPLSAWALAMLVPIIPFMYGAENFINLIALVGGLFIAVDAIFIMFMMRTMRKKNPGGQTFLPFGKVHYALIIGIFFASAVYEVLYQLAR